MAKAKVQPHTSPEYAAKLVLYERLVASIPAVERKGATMPYTSLNGHMFSMLDKTGTLALRLPSPEREAFLAKYTSKLVEMYGRTMEEYVAVPADLLTRTGELKPFFKASYRYVGSLKPKATTRPKKQVATKTAKPPAKSAKAAKPPKVLKSAKAARSRKTTKREKR